HRIVPCPAYAHRAARTGLARHRRDFVGCRVHRPVFRGVLTWAGSIWADPAQSRQTTSPSRFPNSTGLTMTNTPPICWQTRLRIYGLETAALENEIHNLSLLLRTD